MKTRTASIVLSTLTALLFSFAVQAQDEMPADSTGLPGDNFSLEAALEMFKASHSLEQFEKTLNQEDGNINNLDLNEDGQIDYIRVVDNMDGDVHAIVLQAMYSDKESQDVAVIEIEKTGADEATLQIVGDEDIYGSETIVEPFEETASEKSGRGGPAVNFAPPFKVVVNVWLWAPVRFIYRPAYTVYVSPWRWGYYPGWYRPWRPHPWHVYHVRVHPYRVHYHVVTTHRVVRAHGVYTPHRKSCTVVHTRTTTTVKRNGGRTTAKRTTTSTTVKGKHGREATHSTTTTKVERKKGGTGGNGKANGGGGNQRSKGGGNRGGGRKGGH